MNLKPRTTASIAALSFLAVSTCCTIANESRDPASGGKSPEKSKDNGRTSESQKHVEKAKQHESRAAEAADKGRTMEAIKEYKSALGEMNKALEGSGKNQR